MKLPQFTKAWVLSRKHLGSSLLYMILKGLCQGSQFINTMAFLYLRLKMSVPIAKTNYVFDCCIVPLILTCQQNITNGN